MGKRETGRSIETDVARPPRLALGHRQVIWLLSELGFHQGVSTSTFNHYIKSLRRLGVPFEKGRGQSTGRRNVTYDFEDLMELSIALILRVYGTLPDTIVAGLRTSRKDLRPIYRRAFRDLFVREYPAARISEVGGAKMTVNGLYLDLNIRYSAGHIIEFGPPKTISPCEAISLYARSKDPCRSYLPLCVSSVAEMIVALTRVMPVVRRRRAKGRSPSD